MPVHLCEKAMTETNSTSTDFPPVDDCQERGNWIYFVSSSLITFLLGLCVILCVQIGQQIHSKCQSLRQTGGHDQDGTLEDKNEESRVRCWVAVHRACETCISGQNPVGKVVLLLSVLLAAISFIIYLIDATEYNAATICEPWVLTTSFYVDFAINCFFALTFTVQFLAAKNKLFFWLSVQACVDYATIPPSIVGLIMGRQWLGLRFMRGLRLMQVPEVLQYLSVLKSNSAIRISILFSKFLWVWLCSAGFFFWVENTGDFYNNYANAQDWSYWNYLYFSMVTMSTVGYGDIYCRTLAGRIFLCFFIVGALAMFASVIPELVELFGSKSLYSGEYELVPGVKHVVVSGHITLQSVRNFLENFLHEDRLLHHTKYIFIKEVEPSLDMAALFKRHFRHVQYLKGSIMHPLCIRRLKLEQAEACIILADHHPHDPEEEDASNVMRVIAVKNSFPNKRVLVQILLYKYKTFCLSLPTWNSTDSVICLSEVKLGFMAQGCQARGSSTLLANLFVPRSANKGFAKKPHGFQWLDMYMYGAGLEVYTTPFSPYFHGKTFLQVAQFCYKELGLLLIAFGKGHGNDAFVTINPDNQKKIDPDTNGFFICDSEYEVQRVLNYCPHCHSLEIGQKAKDHLKSSLRRCRHIQETGQSAGTLRISLVEESKETDNKLENDCNLSPAGKRHACMASDDGLSSSTSSLGSSTDRTAYNFDSTGLFFWTPKKEMAECSLKDERNAELLKHLEDHIVVCLFKNDNTSIYGLNNFIMPLRSSHLHSRELKRIVIVGCHTHLEKEWQHICNLPEIYYMPEPPSRAILKGINVAASHMCVVLAGGHNQDTDSYLSDKEAILCSLEIKSISTSKSTLWSYVRSVLLPSPYSRARTLGEVVDTAFSNNAETTKSASMSHGEVVDTAFSNNAETTKSASMSHGDTVDTTGLSVRTDFPMLTELVNDTNVQFLDQDDEDFPDCPLYLTQPFACGRAITASVLDSVLCTAFFSPEILGVIRALVTGTTARVVEVILAEGTTLERCTLDDDLLYKSRNSCRLAVFPMDSELLLPYYRKLLIKQTITYQELLLELLEVQNILCLGLYRLMKLSQSALRSKQPQHRFVATNPRPETPLHITDMVYLLLPFKCTFTPHLPTASQKRAAASVLSMMKPSRTKSLSSVNLLQLARQRGVSPTELSIEIGEELSTLNNNQQTADSVQ